MPIPLITNFTINTTAPIDSRMVASSSVARNSIPYIYDGMQVFQLDTRATWIYNSAGATWSISGRGDGVLPGITAGAGAGTSPTIVLNAGSDDVSGVINLTAGTAATTNAKICTITFNTTYPVGSHIHVSFSAKSAFAALFAPYIFTTNETINGFELWVGGTGFGAGSNFPWRLAIQYM